MGMYDDLRCAYPLPGTPPAFIQPGHLFQTKSLDNDLSRYEITKYGKLVKLSGSFFKPSIVRANSDFIMFDGNVHFYTSNIIGKWVGPYTKNGEDAESVDYDAIFRKGEVYEINESGRTIEPSVPAHDIRPVFKPLTEEELAARKSRRQESLKGRTLFLMGFSDDGIEVKVLEENSVEWVLQTPSGEFKIVRRELRESILFDNEEQAKASRQTRIDETKRAEEEYKKIYVEWELKRGGA